MAAPQSHKQVPVLIICDSRGADLQWYIDQLPCDPFNIKVLTYRGKGIIDAVRCAKSTIIWRSPAIIMVLNGICDVTSLDRETRLVSINDRPSSMIIQEYRESMEIVSHFVKIHLDGMKCRVVFAQIVGIDISSWNSQAQSHPQQHLLDSIIHDVNIEIHHNVKGKKKTRYNRLAEDGVHLSDYLKAKWAAEIVLSLSMNYEKLLDD